MLKVAVTLDRLICNADPESSAEPYMWTSFLHADANTILSAPGNRLATYTPHSNWTTRGAFPGGIGAGDIVDIPASLGTYEVILDPGPLNIAIVGTLFVLMEQDSTPGHAIRAGHQAFAEAVDTVLNAYVDEHFPNVPDPTAAEIQALASQIQGDVMGAIYDNLSVAYAFHNHDAFYGFGHLILTDLPEMIVGGVTTNRQFSTAITGALDVMGLQLPYDYQVDLHVRCEPENPVPDQCLREYEMYSAAAADLQGLDLEIRQLIEESRSATDGGPARIRRQLHELRTARRPAALDLVDASIQAYQLCRDQVAGFSAEDPARGRRRADGDSRGTGAPRQRAPVQATVAAATPIP